MWRELDSLVADFTHTYGEVGVEHLDGEDADTAKMRGSLQSLPFLTDRKLVVLREPGKQKDFAENIATILENMPETTDVIIVEPKLDKRLSYYKTLKKQTDFREFAELDANSLTRWAVEYVKMRGSLSLADAKFLIDRVGANQQLVKNELDKLLTYSTTISRQTIELLTETAPQSTVFELLDAAFAGNKSRAMELYKEQRAIRVEPQAIIAMIVWQLHVMAIVRAAGTMPADEIAKSAKLNPFVVRKTQSLARNRTLPQIKTMVQKLLALDIQLKTTAIDDDAALQLYLLEL
jgi:DNA polymerase-3 subunit delta